MSFIGRIALRNATEIEQHAGLRESHGVVGGVEGELAEARVIAGLAQGSGIRQLLGFSRFTPKPDHGRLGDIKRTGRREGQFERRLENAKQVLADMDRLAGRLAAQLHEFAIGIVVRERFVQLMDAGKGGMESRDGLRRRCGIELDAEERPHVGLNHLEGLE